MGIDSISFITADNLKEAKKMLRRCFRLPSFRLYLISGNHAQTCENRRDWLLSSYTGCSWEQQRYLAKGVNRGGMKKIKGNIVDAGELLDIDEVHAEMKKVVNLLQDDYVHQLDVRTSLRAYQRLVVKLPDNSEVPLDHLAQVTIKNPQLAIIDLTASPHAVRSVADALMQSGLCGNPQIQTTTIYVPLQKPSREYREQLVRNAKTLYNRCNEQLREVHRKYSVKLRQVESTAPKDTYKNAQMALQNMMKDLSQEAEKMMKTKQKELMEEIK